MAVTLKQKHDKTIKQMKKLLKGINEAQEGSLGDKKQAEFQYNRFADKWRRTSRTKEYGALLKSLGIRSNLRTAMFRDPKRLYLELNKKREELEKAMGTQYKGDLKGRYGEGIFTGMRYGSLFSSNINPDYDKAFDPKMKKLWEKESTTAKSDYMRSTDRNAPGFDPDGWRLELSEDNPDRKITVLDEVKQIPGTQFPESGMVRDQFLPEQMRSTSQDQKESLKVKKRRRSNYGDDKYAGLTIAGKAPTQIQRNLLDAGHTVEGLELLINKHRDWQAARR